jgi:membrane dipeptidase
MPRLIWDAHACLPLRPDISLDLLERHRRAGVHIVSINVGMDFNPPAQIFSVLASFRRQIGERRDRLLLARGVADVEKARASGRLAVAFDLEGGLPLQGRPDMVALFADLGVRQIHLAYNRDNMLAGGCHGKGQGLTAPGREIVAAINDNGILMDCAHTGERAALDICAISTAPVIISHGNPRALVDHPRNISDRLMRAIAATGGVICINGVEKFLADPDVSAASLVRHITYALDLLGPDHVGLGLDFLYAPEIEDPRPPGFAPDDWWPPEWYDRGTEMNYAPPERFADIAALLADEGIAQSAIDAVLGENMRRVATRVWAVHNNQ